MNPKKHHLIMIVLLFVFLLFVWYFFFYKGRGREGFDGPVAANPAFATDPTDPNNKVTVYPESQMPSASLPVPAPAPTTATTPCNYTDLKLCQADTSCTWSNNKCSVTPDSTSVAAGKDDAAPATPSQDAPTTPVPLTDSISSMVKNVVGM